MGFLWIMDVWDPAVLDVSSEASPNVQFLWLGDTLFPVEWDLELEKRGITRVGLSREESWALQEAFKKDYIEFIAHWPIQTHVKAHRFLDRFSCDGFPLWWLSDPSEKNTLVSPAIQYSLQLLMTREILSRHAPSRVMLHIKEEGFFLALKSLAAGLGIEVDASHSTYTHRDKGIVWFLKKRFRHMLRTMFTFFFCLCIYWRYTDGAILKKGSRSVGFYSLFPETWFLDGDNSRERMYGCLPDELETKGGYRTFFLSFTNGIRPYFEQIQRCGKKTRTDLHKIIPLHAFLKATDIIRSFLDPRPVLRFLQFERTLSYKKAFQFCGIDLYHVFRNEFRRSFIGPYMPRELIHYFGVKNFLRRHGDRVSVFFYFLEFHKWERSLAMSFKRTGHHDKLVGCQHSTISPMSINYFFSPEEIPVLDDEKKHFDSHLPIPPGIVLSGEKNRHYFLESGFNPDTLKVLGSLRYEREKFLTPSRAAGKTKKVFLPASIHPRDAVTSVEMTIYACKKNGFSLVVKSHPVCDISREVFSIARRAGFRDIEVSQEATFDIFPQVETVVTSWTTVSLEALVFGLPVVILSHTNGLDISIFMGERDIDGLWFASDQHELSDVLMEIHREYSTTPFEVRERLWTRYLGGESASIMRNYMDLLYELESEQKRRARSL